MTRYTRVISAVAVLLASLFVGSIPAGAQLLPKIGDITSIVIHNSFGGLGASSQYRETIGHGDGAFIRTDGTLVRDRAVQDLLDALRAPATAITPDGTGFDRARLSDDLDNAEAYIGGAVSLPAARNTFESMFLDSAAMEEWFIAASYPEQLPQKAGTYSAVSVSDFYPSIDVAINAKGHTIDIASHSQRPFMLPLQISGTTTGSAWDPRLARAIAGIMPNGALLRDYLSATSAPYEWAQAIANGRAVSLAIQRSAVDAATAAEVAKSAGFTIEYTITKNPTSLPELGDAATLGGPIAYVSALPSAAAWTGWVSQSDLPQVHYTMGGVRCSALALRMVLGPASAAFTAIHLVPWLTAALAKNPTARVTIDTTDASQYVTELQRNGRRREAEILGAFEQTAVQLTMVGDRSGNSSRWLLLGNGNVILLDYQRDVTFPFDAQWYATLPRMIADDQYGFMGVLVHPDGSIETSPKGNP